jgi:hypothetical protein
MLRTTCTLLSAVLLAALVTACSLYSSAGRKQFEDRSPANTVQPFSLLGCRALSSGEAWFREEFPSRTSELIETNPDFEVWSKAREDHSLEVTVLSKHEGDNSMTQACTYEFASRQTWVTHRKAFLSGLSNSLVDLD